MRHAPACTGHAAAARAPLPGVCLGVALACLALAHVARADDDYPRRRPGLWEVRSVGAEASGLPPTRQCVGAHADTAAHHLDRTVGTRGSCTFGAFRRAGAAWLAESVCREARTVVTSRAVATGDFAEAYRIDTLVSYEPPLGGVRREDRDALEARWIGPCTAGQKPGDLVVPGMGTLNMNDGAFRAEPSPPPAARARRRAPGGQRDPAH